MQQTIKDIMIVVFDKAYLRDFYEKGKCTDKKHRYQPSVIKSYKRAIDYLKQAESVEDLYLFKSLNFEALHGDKKGLFSIRAGIQYRIEFNITKHMEESILTICNIIDLTNHYER